MSFVEHCKAHNIDLLREDILFIKKILKRQPTRNHKKILSGYVEIWRKIMGECENEIQANNLGRRCANQYLLKINDINGF